MSWPNEDRLGTPEDAAKYLALYKDDKPNVRLIEAWCRENRIPCAFKPCGGREWRFPPDEFKAWVMEKARKAQS